MIALVLVAIWVLLGFLVFLIFRMLSAVEALLAEVRQQIRYPDSLHPAFPVALVSYMKDQANLKERIYLGWNYRTHFELLKFHQC